MNEDLLDNQDLINHEADIAFKNGSSFTMAVKLLAAVFVIIGFAMIASATYVGLFLGLGMLFGATFVMTSNFGTEICFKTKYVREYHERFFIKTGKWISTHLLPDICIIKISKTATRSDITGAVSIDIDKSKNEVYLMSANHRKRILIKTCNSMNEANVIAEELAQKLDKRLTTFNPQISKKTQERLRRRR